HLRNTSFATYILSQASCSHFEKKVPEKQKLFQEDNGIPVHLKDGVADALLYRAIMSLNRHDAHSWRVGRSLYQLAIASLPKKQDCLQSSQQSSGSV
uniref:Cytochrome c oxidase subunit 7A2, mitochondrial n=1 Tax=Spermophilus dauricus TaxID=99837 RepID=A0A8C9NZN4_SPEDA